MSAKWIRARKWDDQHLTGWLTPVKVVLRVFSGIPLAVVLLTLVTFYGILASVPIGLIALAPTYIIYGLTALVTVALLALVPVWLLRRGLRQARVAKAARFTITLIAALALVIAAAALWSMLVWPRLRYDPVTHTGFRVFGSFIDQYKSVQFRRLPIMEMSELEFYSWWPLRLVLVLFVINMVTATVRRIEFSFPYIGVLTVHSGIVVIALGSVYYAALKQEGDMLLMAGPMDADGQAAIGPPETGFYDNTEPALWVTQHPDRGWEQRRLGRNGSTSGVARGVPRYNDYNLNALQLKNLPPMARGDSRDHGALNLLVPDGPKAEGQQVVDQDIKFRIVGYASHAELTRQWVPAEDAGLAAAGAAGSGTALRTVEAYLTLPPDPNDPNSPRPDVPQRTWQLLPDVPSRRIDVLEVSGTPLLGIEYTRERKADDQGPRLGGMSEQRWKDLASPLPTGTNHALVVRHAASGFEQVIPVKQGERFTVGQTGYAIEVVNLSADAPFPIITRGYQGARSSVAVVRVTPPAKDGVTPPPFERWVYHRFPEINQDLVDTPPGEQSTMGGSGSSRRAPDAGIDIVYVDASILQIYLDERADGTVRSLVRLPGGVATITPTAADEAGGQSVEVTPGLKVKLAGRLDGAVSVEYPFNTPITQRDTRAIGNHQRASIALEVAASVKKTDGGVEPWKTVVWVPFSQYARAQSSEGQRIVRIPDGRSVNVVFSRVRHEFWPPMALALERFEMTPYPHSQTPRDFSSDLVVMRRWAGKHEDVKRHTSLNEPLLERTPFQRREDLPAVANALGWLMSKIAPNQYKFSQAGWDQSGWMDSLALVERGELKRPMARYTILGVGNNPGIYIIATGAVMMSVGIPWAFYVKPWLMRRRKKKIQEQLARGEYPVKPRVSSAASNGSHAAVPVAAEPLASGASKEGEV